MYKWSCSARLLSVSRLQSSIAFLDWKGHTSNDVSTMWRRTGKRFAIQIVVRSCWSAWWSTGSLSRYARLSYTAVDLYHTVVSIEVEDRGKWYLYSTGTDLFLDSQFSPTNEIVFSIHCLTGMVMCSITMLAYSLAATFVTHVCVQIQVQIARLQDLVKNERRKHGGRDPLSVIIYDRVKTLRWGISFFWYGRSVREAST